MKIAIVAANFYTHITQRMIEGVKFFVNNGFGDLSKDEPLALEAKLDEEVLKRAALLKDVRAEDVDIFYVDGSLEIPLALARIIDYKIYDIYVVIGCVIRGATSHYDSVCNESIRKISDLAVLHKLALGNAILTVESEEQALERSYSHYDSSYMDYGNSYMGYDNSHMGILSGSIATGLLKGGKEETCQKLNGEEIVVKSKGNKAVQALMAALSVYEIKK